MCGIDLRMPGLTGFELARYIDDNFGGTPMVLLITGDPIVRITDKINGAGVSSLFDQTFSCERSGRNRYEDASPIKPKLMGVGEVLELTATG